MARTTAVDVLLAVQHLPAARPEVVVEVEELRLLRDHVLDGGVHVAAQLGVELGAIDVRDRAAPGTGRQRRLVASARVRGRKGEGCGARCHHYGVGVLDPQADRKGKRASTAARRAGIRFIDELLLTGPAQAASGSRAEPGILSHTARQVEDAPAPRTRRRKRRPTRGDGPAPTSSSTSSAEFSARRRSREAPRRQGGEERRVLSVRKRRPTPPPGMHRGS